MELKPPLRVQGQWTRTVLIVPQWNWNVADAVILIFVTSVLIVPQWNWNFWCAVSNSVSPLVLIVPQWNWNVPAYVLLQAEIFRFNRTTVELKRCYGMVCEIRVSVLIVPQWNWNRELKILWLLLMHGFNRTTVELKLLSTNSIANSVTGFNRSTVELKRGRSV